MPLLLATPKQSQGIQKHGWGLVGGEPQGTNCDVAYPHRSEYMAPGTGNASSDPTEGRCQLGSVGPGEGVNGPEHPHRLRMKALPSCQPQPHTFVRRLQRLFHIPDCLDPCAANRMQDIPLGIQGRSIG